MYHERNLDPAFLDLAILSVYFLTLTLPVPILDEEKKLNDCNRTRTHNHLVLKRTLNLGQFG